MPILLQLRGDGSGKRYRPSVPLNTILDISRAKIEARSNQRGRLNGPAF